MNRTGPASRSFPGGVRPGQVLVEGWVSGVKDGGVGTASVPNPGLEQGGGPHGGAAGSWVLYLEAGLVGTKDLQEGRSRRAV